MGRWLLAAGLYNLAWGAFSVLAPTAIFHVAGVDPPIYPELWQCIGMIVGVYGIGYLIAARDPYRHWPIVLVGLLGKVLGPLGFGSRCFLVPAAGERVSALTSRKGCAATAQFSRILILPSAAINSPGIIVANS